MSDLMNEKQAHQFDIDISLAFSKEIAILKPISFEKPFPQSEADKVLVSSQGINISFKRTRKISGDRIFCKTRPDYIQWTLFLLSCMEDIPDAPSIASVAYSVNHDSMDLLDVSEKFQQIRTTCFAINFPYAVIEHSLGNSESAKALRIAISYYWAAAQSISQEERLKLLWGAFNALYRWYAKSKNGKNRNQEIAMLDAINELFLKQNVLRNSLDIFNERFCETTYRDYVRWKLITSARSRSLYVKKTDKDQTHKKKLQRLRLLDSKTLINMRDIGCNKVDGKQDLRNAINEVLSDTNDDNTSIKRLCMLLCRYAYIYRCDSVHANRTYPVFDMENSEKKTLSDLLDPAIIDLATWIANQQVRD